MSLQPVLLKIKNLSTNPLPAYETAGAAGMDIRAFLEADLLLKPMERKLISTGLFLEIPLGYEVQLRARSGLAFKFGITLPNSPATIDSDYRGEIKVALINLGQEDFVVKNGDRIAQMILAKHERAQFEIVTQLTETPRGEGGFGHTGV